MTLICNECHAMSEGVSLIENCPSCGVSDTLEVAMRCQDCGAMIPYSESIYLRSSKKAYCNDCVRERMVWFREFLSNSKASDLQILRQSV